MEQYHRVVLSGISIKFWNLFFHTSFIITTNKSPVEWARTLPDEVLGTALLDRLLYKCELIQLSGYDKYICSLP
ncbi:MAG: ATP-binding protein [Bacteroidales bacterium]|nr:ATP-binding protein [Bacteroidales bacterium]